MMDPYVVNKRLKQLEDYNKKLDLFLEEVDIIENYKLFKESIKELIKLTAEMNTRRDLIEAQTTKNTQTITKILNMHGTRIGNLERKVRTLLYTQGLHGGSPL